jgi:nitronate monooxygenase
LCWQSLRNTVCALRSETIDLLLSFELENPGIDIQPLIKTAFGAVGRNACAAGDITHGFLSAGHAFGFVYKARPMTKIIAHVEVSAHLAIDRLNDAL